MSQVTTELVIARRNTLAFIEADKILVQLRRSTKEETGSGGFRRVRPELLTEQPFRLVPTSTRAGDQSFTTPDGRLVVVREEIIGLHDADIKVFDEFTLEGLEYMVLHISPERRDRKSGWVWQRGPSGSL